MKTNMLKNVVFLSGLSMLFLACTPQVADESKGIKQGHQERREHEVTAVQTSAPDTSTSDTSAPEADSAEVPFEVDVATLHQHLQSDAANMTLFDVRTPAEYAAGHVKQAKLLPLDELMERLDEVPSDQQVYVICRSGRRSAYAQQLLSQAGKQVTNVSGGMNAWVAAGYDVTQ